MDLINRRNFKMRKFEFVKRYNETRKLVDENGDVIEWKLPARSTAKSARI